MSSVGIQFFIIKPALVKLCMDLLWFHVPRHIFCAARALSLCGAYVECYSALRRRLYSLTTLDYNKSMHNFANTDLIIETLYQQIA